MKKPLKEVIYMRCASVEENGSSSIKSQLRELRGAYKTSRIIKKYIDYEQSGMSLNRPALNELRSDAKKGLFDALYVEKPDRLSRSSSGLASILKEFGKNGIRIIFLNGPKYLFSLAIARAHSDSLSERIKRGIKLAKKCNLDLNLAKNHISNHTI